MRVDWVFDFHKLVTMRIRERQWLVDRFLARPGRGYVHHRVDVQPDAELDVDIDVRIGAFGFHARSALVVERRYRVSKDYFACEDTSKILRWKLEIEGFEGTKRAVVRIDKNLFGTAALGSRIIDCLLRYRLNLLGSPAVHGCGVVTDCGAVIFAGTSGVGKSSIAMRMLERGLPLLGDNWIILKGGEALGLHLPINIHDYNVPESLYARLPVGMRVDIQFKRCCRLLSGGYLKKSCPVVLRELFPQLAAEKAPVRRVISLVQADEFSTAKMDKESVVNRMLATDMMDREAFHRYMLAYSSVFPDSLVASHWERLKENIARALPDDAEFMDVHVPKKIDDNVLEKIAAFVD